MGRFGRWQGPTEAEQLAAVSHYAKYASYVPVLAHAGGAAASSSAAGQVSGRRETGAVSHDPREDNDGAGQLRGESQAEDGDSRDKVHQKQQHHNNNNNNNNNNKIDPTGSDMSRTSLLGRPLKIETHNRDLRYRKKQNIIYNFLERPRGWRAALYHFML